MNDYYKTKETVEEYVRLAKDVSGSDLIESLKKVIPADSDVLELGSGPGTDWKILSQFYHTVGSDNSIEFLNYLKKKNPKGEFLEIDAVAIETDRKFDAIYSNKVLHHLRNNELRDSLKRQSVILNEKGIICHSFWKGEGSEIFKGLFVNYHSISDLKTFFEEHFEILSIETYNEFEDDDSILVIARKR